MKRTFNTIVNFTTLFIVGLLLSCTNPNENKKRDPFIDSNNISYNEYNINILDDNKLPYAGGIHLKNPLLPDESSDSNGILMFDYKGNKYYHPVQLAERVLLFVTNYKYSGDTTFIKEGAKYIEKLFELGHYFNDAVYFPYEFSIFPHGGIGENNTILLERPWYSGMAQGQVLEALVKMYKVTENKKYLNYAEQVFKSFLRPKKEYTPWITYIDSNNNFWIEEYPMDTPSHVLNGFIYAIYGLYEYYLLEPDDLIRKELLMASITTIEKNISKYRRPGKASYYCLKHKYTDDKYHYVHYGQLGMLYKICRNTYLKEMSELFKQDKTKP